MQVGASTLAVHLWPPEPMKGIPEPPASGPETAMIPKQHIHILPPGNAMLLSSHRTVDIGTRGEVNIPHTFLRNCFSPAITSSTQVTAHVVIRTQDVARIALHAAAAVESAAAQKQSADNQYLQLCSFECQLRISPGSSSPVLGKLAHNLDDFHLWRIHKLEAVSAAHTVSLDRLIYMYRDQLAVDMFLSHNGSHLIRTVPASPATAFPKWHSVQLTLNVSLLHGLAGGLSVCHCSYRAIMAHYLVSTSTAHMDVAVP